MAVSPNGRYQLVWQDARSSPDGARLQGRYVLIDAGRVVVDRAMERPQDGNVNDTGVFILNDWGDRAELAGTFTAFSPDGRKIVSRAFGANLLNNGLSSDGRWGVCQTCNAPGSPDGSLLAVFDLEAGTCRSCWIPESGWADAYEFPGGDRIRMMRRHRVPLDYTLDGDFLDRQAWLRDDVANGNVFRIRLALREGEAITGLSLPDLAAGTRIAIAAAHDRFRADAYRLLGEIEEASNRPIEALAAYDQALALNAKIGIAKRAAALRRGHER